MYLYMFSDAACRGQFIGNPFPFQDFPLTVRWPSWTCLPPSGSLALPENSFCKIFVASRWDLNPLSSLFFASLKSQPGHGSSRRPRRRRRWSRSRLGANLPSGSGCPSQPGWLCFTWQHIHKLFNFQLKWYNALNIISVFDPTWDIWRGWPWSFPPERRNPQGSEEFSLTKELNCHLIMFEHTLCPHWSLKGEPTCWGERRWGPSPWCCQQGTSGRGKEN